MKAGRKPKYEFHKLLPGTFLEVDFIDRKQVNSLSSCLNQYRKLNQPNWTVGVRTVEGKVRLIRFT